MAIREIIFRGKTSKGEWIYGFYMNKDGKDIIVDTTCGSLGFGLEVAGETVGQFTGLTDKNGKKVYEGDIVKFTDTTFGYSHVGEVCFNKGSFCILYELYGQKRFHRIGKTDEWQDMGASGTITYSYEVIGNIIDNKELLGE